uniref:Uncharacterized protein n=1 Tax=Arundo donax TaxID=35708 RepID=A0A0A9B6J7_ARUDO
MLGLQSMAIQQP